MAPEVSSGHTNYDQMCDMYSLGVVLYELYEPFKTQTQRNKEINLLKETNKCPEILK